jgi:hypothetical protein
VRILQEVALRAPEESLRQVFLSALVQQNESKSRCAHREASFRMAIVIKFTENLRRHNLVPQQRRRGPTGHLDRKIRFDGRREKSPDGRYLHLRAIRLKLERETLGRLIQTSR